jgi:hypothetical protein
MNLMYNYKNNYKLNKLNRKHNKIKFNNFYFKYKLLILLHVIFSYNNKIFLLDERTLNLTLREQKFKFGDLILLLN